MRKLFCVLLILALWIGAAAADQTLTLPDGQHSLLIPDDMEKITDGFTDPDLRMILLDRGISLEIEIYSHPVKSMSIQEMAEKLYSAGKAVELREVSGIGMLCYRETDETDGAPCIGYVYETPDGLTEITFWYGTEEAALECETIMLNFC